MEVEKKNPSKKQTGQGLYHLVSGINKHLQQQAHTRPVDSPHGRRRSKISLAVTVASVVSLAGLAWAGQADHGTDQYSSCPASLASLVAPPLSVMWHHHHHHYDYRRCRCA